MKNIKYYISIIILVINTLACDEYLDIVPDGTATIDNAFSGEYNARKYLATLYSYIPKNIYFNHNPAFMGMDEAWRVPTNIGVHNSIRIALGQQNASDPVISYWDGTFGASSNLFQGIRDCNIFIENIHSVNELSSFEKDQWAAEAKFLKAYFHFYLMKCYGPIPIIDKNLPISSSTEEVRVYREPVDDVVDYIVATLDDAANDLPLFIQKRVEELGRITKPIALGIKARILVTAASDLFNGNENFSVLKDNKGRSLFNAEYDETLWTRAVDACKEAIDIAHEAGHELVTTYSGPTALNDQMHRKMMLRTVVAERWNKELIWGTHELDWWMQNECQPRVFPDYNGWDLWQRYAPNLNVVEQFYTKNGIPIEEDISWDYENRYELTEISPIDRYILAEGELTAQLNISREPRYYAWLGFDRAKWFGQGITDQENQWVVKARGKELAGVFNQTDYSVTGYWAKKWVHRDNTHSGQSSHVTNYPFPMLRLADLYLYYAEALNESKTAPDTDVYEYIDLVRERAGLGGVVESWSNYSDNSDKPLTKEGMRKIIRQERMIELCFEGARFWDLKRWMMAEEYMARGIRGWNAAAVGDVTAENYYVVKTIAIPEFSFKDYFWPIPETELTINPNMVQNLGW